MKTRPIVIISGLSVFATKNKGTSLQPSICNDVPLFDSSQTTQGARREACYSPWTRRQLKAQKSRKSNEDAQTLRLPNLQFQREIRS